ncbi:MAG TPA: nucleotide exchange factor GrpE, partial [Candidatus Angelobacter sp.]|nr:nucleotide exchange factor GrpE [Candidatus Angelobacter sp.]
MTRKKDYNDEASAPEGGGSEPALETETKDPSQLTADLERARAREDELLRAVAELTNVNRRRKQDMETLAQLAQESLVRSILPVLDDIDRALLAAQGREGDPFYSGLVMIRERLWQTLEREGLEAIDAKGAPFDPEVHEAVAQQPSEDKPPGTVLEVVLPGYRFRGRVLRHANVVVAGPRQGSAGESTALERGNVARGAEETDN